MVDSAFQHGAFQGDAFQSGPPPAPIADFTEDKNAGTPPLVVQFTDTSDNYPTSWLWEYRKDNWEWKTLSEVKNPDVNFNISGTYSIRLTATNETGTDTVTKSNLITVSATPYLPYNILKDSKITKRLNDGLTEINTNLSVAIPAHEFHTGQEFKYTIYDTSQKEFTAVSGIIEDVERDNQDASILWALSGRDNGRLLIKQPYNLDSLDTGDTTYTYAEILDEILTDTNVLVGRGQESLREDIKITPVKQDTEIENLVEFSGSWSTKKDALDKLFDIYRKQAGLNKIRWFIDFDGYLRWFEINSDRMNTRYIFKSQGNLISLNPKETCREVINYVKGTWTDDDNVTHTVTVSDSTSIDLYGKCISPTTFTGESEADVTEQINEELAQKKDPIFSGTLILSGFALYEPGTQINFPDNNDSIIKTLIFTVVDWTYDGNTNQTTMNLTTDETVTSIPNEVEIVQSIAKYEASKVLSDVGIVTAKTEGNDRIIVKSTTDGTSENVRDLNSGET